MIDFNNGEIKMTKHISEYTVDELSEKIKAIKAEREKTANALKRYEEELERREQEVSLGVPLENLMEDVGANILFVLLLMNQRGCSKNDLMNILKSFRNLLKENQLTFNSCCLC